MPPRPLCDKEYSLTGKGPPISVLGCHKIQDTRRNPYLPRSVRSFISRGRHLLVFFFKLFYSSYFFLIIYFMLCLLLVDGFLGGVVNNSQLLFRLFPSGICIREWAFQFRSLNPPVFGLRSSALSAGI